MLQLWFVSRALGLVALLVLTLVIVLGVLHNTSVVKNAELGLPRFVLVALHRNLSLITVVFVALHVVTVVVTPYLRLRWIDTVVPGIAAYNPIAAALGTVAVDLVLAITLTSLFRQRIPRRGWFVVHWTAYVCWPVTVVHAVLNASFRGTTWWTLVVPLICLGALVGALAYRRSDQRRTAIPLADRGRVPVEALAAAAGSGAESGAQAGAGSAAGSRAESGPGSEAPPDVVEPAPSDDQPDAVTEPLRPSAPAAHGPVHTRVRPLRIVRPPDGDPDAAD